MAAVHIPMVGSILKAKAVSTKCRFPTVGRAGATLVEIILRERLEHRHCERAHLAAFRQDVVEWRIRRDFPDGSPSSKRCCQCASWFGSPNMKRRTTSASMYARCPSTQRVWQP